MAIYRTTELIGTSAESYADATRQAVARAQKTLRHIEWFEVKELRGAVQAGGIEFQVKLEIGFELEETAAL